MQEHRFEFAESLEDLRRNMLSLGALVQESIARGTQAFLDRDLGLAKRVISDDDAVDSLALAIEEQCYRTLALQSPVAGDLRLIVASLRCVMELERSADLMVNVCKTARRMLDFTLTPQLRGLVDAMSRESSMMIGHAMTAYADGDPGLAAALDDIDDRLDDLQTDFFEAIFSGHQQGLLELRAGVQLALVSRYYERIGDHAVNIGERVIHIVTGSLPDSDAKETGADGVPPSPSVDGG